MITDAEARKIAYDWHGGGSTALYAFASTGAINTARADHDAAREITRSTMAYKKPGTPGYAEWRKGMQDLGRLRVYLDHHGTRPAFTADEWNRLAPLA
jgi:hypothetical protein